MSNACFPLGIMHFGTCWAKNACLAGRNKNPGLLCPGSGQFPWWMIFYTYYTSFLEELSSCVTPWLPLDFVHVPFPFAEFAWCSFSVINHSCEHRSVLCPVGTSSKLLNLRMFVETPDIGGSVQFSSVTQSCPTPCDPMNCSTPGLPVHHQLPEFTQLTSIESVMPPSHLILCCPLLLLPPIPPSIRVFANESALRMRWPKYWSFCFSIIPSKEIPGLISFRMDWLDLLALQGTLKSPLQHHSSKHQFFGAQPSSQSNSHIHT